MNPQQLETFFVLYLQEKKIEYKIKDRIYTVKLDKTHQKWFNLKELVCTFDQNLARQKKCILLGIGTAIFDTMLTQYTNTSVVGHFKIKKNKKDLLDVNERLAELNKPGIKYTITEDETTAEYFLFQTTIQSAKEKKTVITPLIILKNSVGIAQELSTQLLEPIKKEIVITEQIDIALKSLPKILNSEIETAEKNHENELKEYEHIKSQHCEDQYRELQKKEDEILSKIEEMKEKSLSASSFNARNEYEIKIKELKKKHTTLIEKNKETRENIKQEFDKELSQLKVKELTLHTKITAYAQIETPYYTIEFKDKEKYYYLPLTKQFINASLESSIKK